MPLLLQAKLLEVLQSNEFARLGGTDVVKVNTWVLASTNHELEKDMKQGLFREDLYYRLNIIKVEMPPLRERKDDILLLIEHLIDKYRSELNMDRNFVLNGDMRDLFMSYPWPGNVRELASTLLRLMIGDEASQIKSDLLRAMAPEEPSASEEQPLPKAQQEEVEERRIPGIPSLKEVKARAAEDIERKAILSALNSAGWNKREAARMLKISYKALFNKLNGLGIGRQL
jgi:two-component system response regulator AtoC